MLWPEDPDLCVQVLDSGRGPQDELRAICKSGVQEHAFYVCDMDTVAARWELWRRMVPRVLPHYAVKCNSSRAMLSTMAALGVGFDCASEAEIDKVLWLGVDCRRIIYAHPAKPVSHIRHAAKVGVNLATFDSEGELHKMKALHPQCKLVLRIRCDDDSAKYRLGEKFGCDAASEAPRLLRAARVLGLDVVGVCFHVGSGSKDPLAFRKAIELARGVFTAGSEQGFAFSLLDIGGGYPGDDDIAFAKIAEAINEALDEFFPPCDDVRIISEPGSFFACAAFTLATHVLSRREIRDASGDIASVMYFINDGIFGSFFDVLADKVCRGEPLETTKSSRLLPSIVWGPTLDSVDKVESNVHLPLLEVGSWLVYHNMGAYTCDLATTFNGFPISKIHTVVSKRTWLRLRQKAPLSEVPHCAVPRLLLSSSACTIQRASRASDSNSCKGLWQRTTEWGMRLPLSAARIATAISVTSSIGGLALALRYIYWDIL